MGKLLLSFACVVYLACAQLVLADGNQCSNLPPPQAVVDCVFGCQSDIAATDNGNNYRFYVEAGGSIILSGYDSQGSSLYSWDNQKFSPNTEIAFQNIRSASSHTLAVEDQCGRSDSVTVNIYVTYNTPCQPRWDRDDKITLDSDLGRREFSPGDTADVVIPRPDNDCNNYKAVCSSSAVSLTNDQNGRALLHINALPSGESNPVIRLVARDGQSLSPNPPEYEFRMVPNTAPTIKISWRQENGRIVVSCAGSKTGSNGDEGEDFIKYFRAFITDIHGNRIDSGDSSPDYGEKVGSITLNPDEAGAYILHAEIYDSHGAKAQAEPQWIGVYGARGDMPSQVVLPRMDYSCQVGKACVIDASAIIGMYNQTNLQIEFWDVTYHDHPRFVSQSPLFEHVYSEVGLHDLQIRVKKFGTGDYYTQSDAITVRVV